VTPQEEQKNKNEGALVSVGFLAVAAIFGLYVSPFLFALCLGLIFVALVGKGQG
jgi:hypothetical protein